jgi:hypothetical protein
MPLCELSEAALASHAGGEKFYPLGSFMPVSAQVKLCDKLKK